MVVVVVGQFVCVLLSALSVYNALVCGCTCNVCTATTVSLYS